MQLAKLRWLAMVQEVAFWGRVPAAALFGKFVAGQLTIASRGQTASCGCFGGRSPISAATIARATVLCLLAAASAGAVYGK